MNRLYFVTVVVLLMALLLTACAPTGPTASPETHQQLLPMQQNQGASAPPAPLSPLPTPIPMPEPTNANADVEFVRAQLVSDGSWTFSVTVRHPDTGWDDYADGWDVVLADGSVVKPDPQSPYTRLLLHPHENEQPFTRSQSGIILRSGVTQVMVRAHDLVDGWGGKIVTVDLSQASGPDFEVQR